MRAWSSTTPCSSGPVPKLQPDSVITIGGRAARKRARNITSHSRSASGTIGQPKSVVG